MEGYIKLSRKFFSNDLWNEARPFSGCEAWLDLIQSARFEETPKKDIIGGREVSYTRGQYPASIRFLARRWKWSERKVRTFLSYLENRDMITLNNEQGINVITLVKYEEYNGKNVQNSDTANDTASDTANDTANDTTIRKRINKLRGNATQQMTQGNDTTSDTANDTKLIKDNNNKEDTTNVVSKKDAAKAATLSRRKIFYESLIPYVQAYGKEMVRAFYNYWTEMNKSCTKMKFEKQETWELPLRLSTWAGREKNKPVIKNYDVGIILTKNTTDKYDDEGEWANRF